MGDAQRSDLVRWPTGDVLATDQERAGGGRDDAADGACQRGLAGAVGAENGDRVAGLDGQVDALQNTGLAVAGADPGKLQRGRGGSLRRGRGGEGRENPGLRLRRAEVNRIVAGRRVGPSAGVSRAPPVPR